MQPFLVDVDGVLATFVDDLFSAIGSSKRLADALEWDLNNIMDERERAASRWVYGDPDFWRKLGLVEGAQAGVEALRRVAPVVFVTSPYYSCREWEHARRDWLKRNFDAHPSKDLIVTGSKHLVTGRTLIDDKPEHCEQWWTGQLQRPLLFDAPYNRSAISLPRLKGWADLSRVIVEGTVRA